MIYDMIVILITLPYNLVFLLLLQDLKNNQIPKGRYLILEKQFKSKEVLK